MAFGLPGIGVYGTGPTTFAIIPHLKNLGYRVEAIWGRQRDEAEKTSAQLGIPFSTDKIDDVLLHKDVDLILILCPPFHHSQIAVKALGIGKHVCVQSPCGLNQHETLRMVQAAQYYPSLLSVLIHGLRFLPCFVKMRDLIRSGFIGDEINLIDVRLNLGSLNSSYSWSCDQSMGGGALMQFGSQVIDLIYFLLGGRKALRAHGIVRTFNRQTENISGIRQISADDLCCFQLEMSGESFATVTINSHFIDGYYQEVVVSGRNGYLACKNGTLYGRNSEKTKEEEILTSNTHIDSPSSSTLPQIYLHGVYEMFSRLNFSKEAVRDSNHATFEDALYVHAVIEAVKRSSKEKAWTKVIIVQPEEPSS